MALGIYFIFALIIAGLVLFFSKKGLAPVFAGVFVLVQIIFSLYAFIYKDLRELQYFTFDALSLVFLLLLSFISLATFAHSVSYLKDASKRGKSLFYLSFIAINVALTGVYTANNIIVAWIFIELTTLSAAGLINHNRNMNSLEATWKYVFICSVGIAIAYVGILFASATAGTGYSTDMSFQSLHEIFKHTNPVFLKLAFLLILAGYSSKLEVFPLYTIGIDANYAAPAPVSAFMSTALVNGGFVAFSRIFMAMSDSSISLWMNKVLIITGILSLLVSAIYMQKSKNLKRLFAYSTVEHMGIILISLSLGKIGIYIALFQICLHSFIKSGLFYQSGILHQVLKSYKFHKAGGYMKVNPLGGIILLTGMILITAIPPSGIFISEFMLFRELGNGHWIIFILVALLASFIMYGIFTKNSLILFGEPGVDNTKSVKAPFWEYITQLVFFSIAIIACFYIPDFLNNLFKTISGIGGEVDLSIFNF
jgi:hydrogenase-4 component F